MKKSWIMFIIILVIMVAIFIAILIKNSDINGKIINIDSDSRIITVKSDDQEIKLKVNNNTKLFDIKKHPALFSDFNIGFSVVAKMRSENGALNVEWIKIEKSPNIVIISPENNAIVRNKVKIEGIARVFENVLQIEIKDKATKKIIYAGPIMAHPLDIGLFGPFETIVDLTKYVDLKNIELSAFQYSAKDGSIVDKITINLDIIK